MKIEKVNENQIRCTLTREDLASRELKISELAYGTEKAKTLFRDMMRQANFEFGFEAEDIPLMIEAIPLNAECIVLIITKVEDPEELDTRFSRFAPSVTEDEEEINPGSPYAEATDEMFDLLRKIQTPQQNADENAAQQEAKEHARIFRMASLQQVITVSSILSEGYQGLSSLYKVPGPGTTGHRSAYGDSGYLLVLTQGGDSSDSFDKACNIVSEYGAMQRSTPGGSAYLAEHCEALIRDNAVNLLGNPA